MLCELDVISGSELDGAEGNHYRRGVVACVENNAFAENLTGQIIPLVSLWSTSEAVHHVLIVLGLRRVFRRRTLVTENAEGIPYFHALTVAEVHVNGLILSHYLMEALASNTTHHRLPSGSV